MNAKFQPLYDKLNSIQTEIKQAESEFVQHSIPRFRVILEKRENILKNTGDYIAEVILNSDGNEVNVNGKYENINPEQIRTIDRLFT